LNPCAEDHLAKLHNYNSIAGIFGWME